MITGEPIVPNARYTVRCACGFAADSAAENAAAALAEGAAQHRCPLVSGLTATAVSR